jgi:hypothetical protein
VSEYSSALAKQIAEMIDAVLETADLTPEERAEYEKQREDVVALVEEKVEEMIAEDADTDEPKTLGEAVTRFQELSAAIRESGTVTDLAKIAMNRAAKTIVEIAADGPNTDCLTCRFVRAAGRAAFVMSELAEHILGSHEEDPDFDGVSLETGIATLNTELITTIIDAVEAHRGGH